MTERLKQTDECRGLLVIGETPGERGYPKSQESTRGQVLLSSEPKSYEKVSDLIAICPNYPFPSYLRLKSNYTPHEKSPGKHLIFTTPLWSLIEH